MAAAGSSTIPASFLCPITQEPMQDPVATADGHVYERKAIEEWFQTCGTPARSPLTNQPLRSGSLVPNPALRRAIEEYLGGEPMLNPAASDSMQLMLEGLQEKAFHALHLQESLKAFRWETRAIRTEMGGLLSLLQDSFRRLDELEHSFDMVLNVRSPRESSESTCSSPSRCKRSRQHASVGWESPPAAECSPHFQEAEPAVARAAVAARPPRDQLAHDLPQEHSTAVARAAAAEVPQRDQPAQEAATQHEAPSTESLWESSPARSTEVRDPLLHPLRALGRGARADHGALQFPPGRGPAESAARGSFLYPPGSSALAMTRAHEALQTLLDPSNSERSRPSLFTGDESLLPRPSTTQAFHTRFAARRPLFRNDEPSSPSQSSLFHTD